MKIDDKIWRWYNEYKMDVNTDQPQLTSDQPITEPGLPQDNPRMPKFLGVAIIFLAVTIGYITLANFQQWFPFKPQRIAVSTPTPSPTSPTTPTPTPTAVNVTADWETYVNSQYGFEFQHPAHWTLDHPLRIQDNTINVLGNSDGGVELSIDSNESEYLSH